MKTNYLLGTCCLLAFALTACQKNTGDGIVPDGGEPFEVTIEDNTITGPQWLVHTVDSVADTYRPAPAGGRIYPSVYGVEYGGQDYIYVVDWLESCWTCGNMYFTLSGASVDPGTSLYEELTEARPRDGYRLLWRQE